MGSAAHLSDGMSLVSSSSELADTWNSRENSIPLDLSMDKIRLITDHGKGISQDNGFRSQIHMRWSVPSVGEVTNGPRHLREYLIPHTYGSFSDTSTQEDNDDFGENSSPEAGTHDEDEEDGMKSVNQSSTPATFQVESNQNNAFVINHNNDSKMSGGKILIRSQPLSAQPLVNLNMIDLTLVNSLPTDRAVEDNVKRNQISQGHCLVTSPCSSTDGQISAECEQYTKLTLTDEAPQDLSLTPNAIYKNKLNQTLVTLIRSRKAGTNSKNEPYLVDEGIKPLCLMSPADRDTDRGNTNQNVSSSTYGSIQHGTPSGVSPSDSGVLDYTSKSIESRQLEVSKLKAAQKTLGLMKQKLHRCLHCGLLFKQFNVYLRHLDSGCAQRNSKEMYSSGNLVVQPCRYKPFSAELNRGAEANYRDRGLHVCHVCNATYKARSALVRHVERVHSGLSIRKECPKTSSIPICPVCGDWFTSIQGFKFHMKVHRKTDLSAYMFTCTSCGGRYMREDQLERHIKRMHPSKTLTKAPKLPYSHVHFKLQYGQ